MKKQKSFTDYVKEEIVDKQYSNDQLIIIIATIICIKGYLNIQRKQEKIILKIENAKIAKFIYNSIQQLFQITSIIHYFRKTNLNKNIYYLISINIQNENILKLLHIDILHHKIKHTYLQNKKKEYLIGIFLACGSVNSFIQNNYHLELILNNQEQANYLSYIVNNYKKIACLTKIIQRRKKYVVYLKQSKQIINFLVLIGAIQSSLELENLLINKNFNNNQKRLINLDTANYQKILKNAKKDIIIIQKLMQAKHPVFNHDKIKQIALLRMQNPDNSFQELADLASQKNKKKISKNNVYYIINNLRKIYYLKNK